MTGNGPLPSGVKIWTGKLPPLPWTVWVFMVTPGSGAVLWPASCSTFFTASAADGCLRASSGLRVSIGFGFSDAIASSTFCIFGSAFGGWAAVWAIAVPASMPAASATMVRVSFFIFFLIGFLARRDMRP